MYTFQPVIKWSGSKRSQAKEIIKFFPQEIDTYYEPFVGGGMFKDIETPCDTQSRIIEVDNWDDYVNEIKNQKQVYRHSWIGSLYGVSFPKGATMKYFDADDNRLVCTFYRWDNVLQMKTAYICK